ncbi:glycosyltransferase [Vibrio lentus]
MLLVANTLAMNGGSTFLIRFARKMSEEGRRMKVLVLFGNTDIWVKEQLSLYAEIFYLKDFLIQPFGKIGFAQLPVFFPINWKKMDKILSKDLHIHAMGVFGVILATKIINRNDSLRLSIGVYHQREFMHFVHKFYFCRLVHNVIKNLPEQNFVFFNEKNKKDFCSYYERSFEHSCISPIGVEIRERNVSLSFKNKALVSIGNLIEFKKYNEHIIRLIPNLLVEFPGLKYNVYGSGPRLDYLQKLALDLGVQDNVTFYGKISYDEFYNALEGQSLFIGSGTAIIEASSVGLPSIVGIESISEPTTFGYLSEIVGFDYNEDCDSKVKYSLHDKISDALSSQALWDDISFDCKTKSKEFSITETTKKFSLLESLSKELPLTKYSSVKLFLSYIFCAICECTGLDKRFSDRRNLKHDA